MYNYFQVVIKPSHLLLAFLTFTSLIYSQEFTASELDSLFTSYVQLKNIEKLDESDRPLLGGIDHGKCGLSLVNAVRLNYDKFTSEQQQQLNVLFQRPLRQKSFVTPSGKFRIHYNETGSGVPAYDLNELAKALDSSYNFEVNYLGYPPPPPDFGEGGDDLYDVYIADLGSGPSGLYGYTESETEIIPNSGRWTSFIVIDNAFDGYYTPGIDGARVTAAHELHHAIQMGNYIFRFSDIYFYEITSTAMEKFVYNTLNDYRQYLSSYFQAPWRSFSQNNGYNLAIWNFYLKEKFGYDILKRQWELMPQMRAISAIAMSIAEYSSGFGDEFNTFGIWSYFTNYRTIPGRFFADAQFYPAIQHTASLDFNPPAKNVDVQARAVSNNFIRFINQSATPLPDTLVAIVTNSDIQSGIDSTQSVFSFRYTLASDSGNGFVRLTDKYFMNLTAQKINFWSTAEILNNEIIREGKIRTSIDAIAFPSPFKFSRHSFVYLPADPDPSAIVDFAIYTSGMELIYSSTVPVIQHAGQKVVRWDGKDFKGRNAASGIYLFITKSGDNIKKGKLVIFND